MVFENYGFIGVGGGSHRYIALQDSSMKLFLRVRTYMSAKFDLVVYEVVLIFCGCVIRFKPLRYEIIREEFTPKCHIIGWVYQTSDI